jgi:hypothetical protein
LLQQVTTQQQTSQFLDPWSQGRAVFRESYIKFCDRLLSRLFVIEITWGICGQTERSPVFYHAPFTENGFQHFPQIFQFSRPDHMQAEERLILADAHGE